MPSSLPNWTTAMLYTLALTNHNSVACSWFRTQPPNFLLALKSVNISPLASLHWLLIRYRTDFKLLLTVYKTLHGLAPLYLSDLLHLHIPSRALRSADQLLLEVPRSRLKTRGDRAFAVAVPKLWNCLPLHIRAAESVGSFKSLLKTHLFSACF